MMPLKVDMGHAYHSTLVEGKSHIALYEGNTRQGPPTVVAQKSKGGEWSGKRGAVVCKDLVSYSARA